MSPPTHVPSRERAAWPRAGRARRNTLTVATGAALAAMFLVGPISGCTKTAKKRGRHARVAPVKVAVARTQAMPIEATASGMVEAFQTVSIRSQVSGMLKTVAFKEGQEVKKGDLLFRIDPRPFRAALTRAKQALARDQVTLANANKQARRYASLVKKEFVTQQQNENAQTQAASLKATVAADKAAVRTAELNVQNCTLRAPISGRTGTLGAHPGDLVKAMDTQPLVVIAQIQPIRVDFSIPEVFLPRLRAVPRSSVEVDADPGSAPASAGTSVGAGSSDGAEKDAPAIGKLTFVDNQVTASTGMILLKADFPNKGERMWPGEFVDVTVKLGVQKNATVIPTAALQTSQQGTFVFVVKPDHTVVSRPVKVERSDAKLTVIAQGVKPGETVVTDGQLRLRPGTHVRVTAAGGQAGRQASRKRRPSSAATVGRKAGQNSSRTGR